METTTKFKIVQFAMTPFTVPLFYFIHFYPFVIAGGFVFAPELSINALSTWLESQDPGVIGGCSLLLSYFIVRPLVFLFTWMYSFSAFAIVLWVIGVLLVPLMAIAGMVTEGFGSHTSGSHRSGIGLYLHAGTRGISMTLGGRVAGGWLSIGKKGIGWRKSKRIF